MNTIKTFKRIRQSDKSYIILVNIYDTRFNLEYCYNSISGGYMGTQIECFIESIRGIIRVVPEFFDVFDTMNPIKSLRKLGFEEIEPTELEIIAYEH